MVPAIVAIGIVVIQKALLGSATQVRHDVARPKRMISPNFGQQQGVFIVRRWGKGGDVALMNRKEGSRSLASLPRRLRSA